MRKGRSEKTSVEETKPWADNVKQKKKSPVKKVNKKNLADISKDSRNKSKTAGRRVKRSLHEYCDDAAVESTEDNINSRQITNDSVTDKSTYYQYFNCKLCDVMFTSKAKLKKHEKTKCGKYGSKKYGCQVCGKGFLSEQYMMDHVNYTHNGEEPLKFKCSVCKDEFRSVVGLKIHIEKKHSDKKVEKLPFSCEYCQKSYSARHDLKRHLIKLHLETNFQRYECAHCSLVLFSRKGLIWHIQTKHLPGGHKKCTRCMRNFTVEAFIVHVKSDSCKIFNLKEFVCEHCGRICKSKNILHNHILTHSDEKGFICQTCGKGFRTESNLTQHLVTHSDVRPFSCDLCDKSFRIRNHLRQHMAVHGLVNTVVKQRKKTSSKE